MKAGLFVEHTTRPAQRASTLQRHADFNTDGSNPLNTNVGFANALLGVDHPVPGVRRPPGCARPVHEHRVVRAGQLAREAELHHRRRAALLLPDPDLERWRRGGGVRSERLAGQPGAAALHAGRRRRRAGRPRTRSTGEIFPLVYLGRLVPGTGNFINGMEVFDGHAAVQEPVQAGAAHRVRVGRDRRRQDRGPRRRRRVLRPLLRRQHPRPGRAAAAAATPIRPTTRPSRSCWRAR